MNIIKASPADLVEVLYLLKICIQEMNSKGWFHWDLQYLEVKEDVEKGRVFLYKETENTLGAITLCNEIPSEYKDITWTGTADRALVASRLMVHPVWRNQGIAKELFAFAEEYAKKEGRSSLRLDVYSENPEAVSLFNQLSFKQLGKIQHPYQKSPYFCFEKTI